MMNKYMINVFRIMYKDLTLYGIIVVREKRGEEDGI